MKSQCRRHSDLEKWFDGAHPDPESVRAHVEQCRQCARQLSVLRAMRGGVAAVRHSGAIADASLPAFVRGVQDGLARPRPARRRTWALFSLTAAALIVAASAFFVLDGGAKPVSATVVESCATDLEGATITSYDTDEDVTTVWITVDKEDVW